MHPSPVRPLSAVRASVSSGSVASVEALRPRPVMDVAPGGQTRPPAPRPFSRSRESCRPGTQPYGQARPAARGPRSRAPVRWPAGPCASQRARAHTRDGRRLCGQPCLQCALRTACGIGTFRKSICPLLTTRRKAGRGETEPALLTSHAAFPPSEALSLR